MTYKSPEGRNAGRATHILRPTILGLSASCYLSRSFRLFRGCYALPPASRFGLCPGLAWHTVRVVEEVGHARCGPYRQLLGIEAPWKVETVEMSVPEQRVAVVVTHARGVRFACPECGGLFSVYDHSEERAWRHLDSCGFATWLRTRPPRVHCPEHGVRQVACPGPNPTPGSPSCSNGWPSTCSARPTSRAPARSFGSAGTRHGT